LLAASKICPKETASFTKKREETAGQNMTQAEVYFSNSTGVIFLIFIPLSTRKAPAGPSFPSLNKQAL